MKIKKLANSNIEFLTDSDELIAVMQQIGAQLIVNAEGVKIIQTGYPEFYIKTEDVVSTQLMPAAAIAFTGDTTALVALLSASFFVLTSENIAYDPTGTGLTATTVQDAITELATEWTETTVNITSAQILAMGTVPVELLAAPGAGNYYVIDYLVTEYTHLVAYDLTGVNALNVSYGTLVRYFYDLFYASNKVSVFQMKGNDYTALVGTEIPETPLNTAITMSTDTNLDPTVGTGTIKAKIKYKIVTFG